jgi:hypothetical protein
MNHGLKFSLGLLMAFSLLLAQGARVFASSAGQNALPVSGVVQSLTLETDASTGVTTVIVDILKANDLSQPVRVSLETAFSLGLVVLDEDGKPGINHFALGKPVEIDPRNIIPDQPVDQHPIGSALATIFSNIPGMDYETIMIAHQQGIGFGVIAETLWLTTRLEGNSEVFEAILHAKQTGDYSAFTLEDGTIPKNWGQLRQLILDQKNELQVVTPHPDHTNNGNHGANGNGGGNGNGSNHRHGNRGGNGGDNGGNGNGHGNDK